MKQYTTPEMEIVELDAQDVITTSGGGYELPGWGADRE